MEWLDMRDALLRCSCSNSRLSLEGRRNRRLGGLKTQTIPGMLTTLLSVSAPIVLPALVFVPLGREEPDDKF